jgi:hypothetical protein
MKKKFVRLLLLITVEIELAVLVFWLFHCNNFQEILHVSFWQLALQLKGEAGQDFGLPLLIIRLFHNKPIDALLLIIKTYFRFWDFLFTGGLFPLIGSFGILAAGYYFFASTVKRTWQWILFILFLVLPFIELFLYAKIPFLIRIGLFYAVFGFISVLGIKKFALSQKWGFIILTILVAISLWWFAIADFRLANFCYQYP